MKTPLAGPSRTPGTYDAEIDSHPTADRAAGAAPDADHGRWARRVDGRRRLRRRVAVGLAAAGLIAIVVGLSWKSGDGGEVSDPQPVTVNGGVTQNTAKPPTTAPGGVGENPEKTGLPAVPPDGGRVRTGTKEEGCFASMREYLDAWDRTGVEPDPCFISQGAAEQPQPDGVVRSYNGEKF
ncbi:MAG TPA: hypothetical protein VEG38_00050 [Acidimicrobiia bacterium]|nr:hypothetical protein [Acidimicrobiia bacterium]